MSDKDDLLAFLTELESLLASILPRAMQNTPISLRGPLDAAWSDVPPAFEDTRSTLSSGWEDLLPLLRLHGLTERHLALKIGGFREALRRWTGERAARLLRSVLDWADIILDSIAACVPQAGILKEFKDCIRQIFNDTES